jgi:hypothetical protein
MEYQELRIEILPGRQPGEFMVRANSKAGDGEGRLVLPFALSDLVGVVHGIHPYVPPDPAAAADAKPATSPPAKPPQAAIDYGQQLFDALFNGEVLRIFDGTRRVAESQDLGVRVRISVNLRDERVCEAAALPWELMRASTSTPLSISTSTPVVRYVDTDRPTDPLPLTGPLRILAVKSNPQGTTKLDLDAELQAIEACWKELLPNVEYEVVDPNLSTILDALAAKRRHVLHYMGHGAFDEDGGSLLLEDENGDLSPVPAEQFAGLVEDAKLRLVFLNACQSGRTSERSEAPPFAGVAAALIHAGIPAVVGNQFSVRDDMAIKFSRTFYQRIADGQPVDEAVASARKILFASPEMPLFWATPVLYMRSTNGDLFTRQDAAVAPAPAAAPVSPPPEPVAAMSEPSNRGINISGGTVSGVNFTTGDNNTITSTVTTNTGPPPPVPTQAEMAEVMQQLHALVAQIQDAKQKSIATNALNTADLEVQDAKPDKANAANSLTQAVQILKSSDSLGDKAVELAPLVGKAIAWLTPTLAVPLMKLLG